MVICALSKKNAFLEINHSYKQKDYVDWKFNNLKSLVKSPPKFRVGNEGRTAYCFYTRQLPVLTELFYNFYEKKVKIIPKNLKLDPLVIAVWFMDDGSKCRTSDVYLNTQQFDIESQRRLIVYLKYFNLETKLNKDKSYYRLRFIKSSLPKLRNLINKYIIPSMRYKIEL
jgi:hypothetical protein